MSKCIKCGRELTSAEIPEFYNGMCEKCSKELNCAEYPFKQGIYDYQKQLDQLKQQLAEKDKEIERLKNLFKLNNEVVINQGQEIFDLRVQVLQQKQNQTQLAIQELEKVKENLKQLEINIDNQAGFSQGYKLELKQKSLYKNVYKTIDQQINELKGEKDVED